MVLHLVLLGVCFGSLALGLGAAAGLCLVRRYNNADGA
jgi:hypothetical protein